jgi:hypothetical protein
MSYRHETSQPASGPGLRDSAPVAADLARYPAEPGHGVRYDDALRQDGIQRGEHYQRSCHSAVSRDITAAVRQRDEPVGIAVAVSVGVGVTEACLPSFGHVENRQPGRDDCPGGRPEFSASRYPHVVSTAAKAFGRAADNSSRAGAEPYSRPPRLGTCQL